MAIGGAGNSTDSPTFSSETGMSVLFGNPQAANLLTDNDRQKAMMLWEMYTRAKKWKNTCGWENTPRWWDFWKGRQWAKRRPSSKTMAVINLVYETVETFLGHVSDDLPSSACMARNPEQKPIADRMTKLVSWSHDINNFDMEIELPVRSAMVTGLGARKIWWDYRGDKGRGCPRQVFVDESTLFLSPWTKKAEEAEYIIEAANVPLQFIRRTWDRGAIVPAGTWDGTLTPLQQSSGLRGWNDGVWGGDYAAFTTTDGNNTQVSKGAFSKKEKDLATLIDAWIRQDDGTLRRIVCANGVILEDGPSPFNDEEYPYVLYNVIRSKDHAYGYSLVEQLEKLQTELNEMHSYMVDQQRYESDSPLVVHSANIKEHRSFTNEPGSIYIDQAPNGNGYYILNKPGANPKWLDIQEKVQEMIRSIGGNVDILRGERPAGVSTLGGMEIVREEANVLVAKMVKPIQAAVKEEDEKLVERMKQFMKDERTVRVMGPNQQQQYMTVNKRVGLDANGGWIRDNEIPDDFEADVTFKAVPPGGLQAKFERDMDLLKGQVVDGQWVLEDLDEDQAKIDALNQRLARQAQAQQQAMAAQQAAQNGQTPQGPEIPGATSRKVMHAMMG